ncbi:MAG: methyl-accepting chemotaxis protein [Oscillospiraceae bacterium]|nr:methyl-accepting chemotaxis protein [Oscillospiraceae bacterium]
MRMKLKTKIIGGLLCVFVLATILGAFGFVTIMQFDNMQQDVLLLTELNDTAIGLVMAHHVWVYRLAYAFLYDLPFPGGLDPHTCIYGNWLASDMPGMIDDAQLKALIDAVFVPHYDLHVQGGVALRYREEGRMEEALDLLYQVVFPAGIESTNRITALSGRYEELRDLQLEAMSDFVTRSIWTIVIIFAVALVIFLLLSGFITRSILKPIKRLVGLATETAQGSLAFDSTGEDLVEDEIGKLYSSFADITGYLNKVCDDLKRVANGSLDIDVTVRSEGDVLSQTLQKMLDDLNSMFGEITTSTGQVTVGAKQIADGAQSLAQGSTEQAASVQQLSSSIADIAQKTKDNADMAGRAAVLATDIKSSAEKGSSQMDEMMAAVKDINTSSQNISKVIKSIDDIAFQTNILALNAAVEAARAGQHGKGFAVVAEEVRNLAAKSAEAAKDTESLIADSIEKAELGSRIADGTAASLVEIVSGINESTQLVNEISKSSEEQSEGIANLNRGIDQVAHATQQNSATAEQSAAAAEEMSGQSMLLGGLISRFKLKNSNTLGRLPASAPKLPVSTQGESGDTFGKY